MNAHAPTSARVRSFEPGLVAIDLDGTLLRSDKTVSDRARTAIRGLQRAGVDLVACTGRPPRMVRQIAADLDLPQAIIMQGSATYHSADDRVELHQEVNPDVVFEVLARVRSRHPDAMCALETSTGWFVDDALADKRGLAELPEHERPDGIGRVEDFVSGGIVKIMIRDVSSTAPILAEAISGMPVYHTWTSPDLLEILAGGINKQVTLARYAQARQVPRDRVAAFGDQHNDQEMLAWAGLGIAMANGSVEARSAADVVTGTNDEDGVAEVLELWLDEPMDGTSAHAGREHG